MGFFDRWRRPKPDAPPAATAAIMPPCDTEIEARCMAVRDALDAPLVRLYGDQTPFVYGATIYWADGGPDPLDAVCIYWNDDGPHWHYVTRGMSELGPKVSGSPNVSGWGFELTMRLAAHSADRGTEPEKFLGSIAYNAPGWPVTVLNDLGRHVFNKQRPYRPDDYVEQMRWAESSKTQALLVLDPDLGNVTTPNGRVSYLQVVTIDAASLATLKEHEQDPAAYDAAVREILVDRPLGICVVSAS